MTASATHDVLVIVPSRSRPANSIVFAETFLAHSTRSDLLFALDEDDPLFPAYAGIAGVQYELNPRLRLVGTLNLLANTYLDQYTYLAFMGDDHRIRTPGWDQRLVEAIGDVPHGIAYGNDLLPGDPLPSAVLLNASIVRSLGYIAPPDLIHHGTATFWHDLGQALGTLRYREDVIIEHQPVSAGTTAPDELFAETHAPDAVARDLAAYQRYAQHRFREDLARLSGTPVIAPPASVPQSEPRSDPPLVPATTKTFDCFTFFNEIELVEIRLHELADVVDYHVIAESTQTHNGQPRELCFDLWDSRWDASRQKIIYIPIYDVPENIGDWGREKFYRNAILRALDATTRDGNTLCAPDDLVLVSDADELPRASAVRVVQNQLKNGIAHFEMSYFNYHFNQRAYVPSASNNKEIVWHHDYYTHAARRRSFATPEQLKRRWSIAEGDLVVPDAGWHFSWMGGIKNIQLKFATFAHQELNYPESHDPDRIATAIEEGRDHMPNADRWRFKVVPLDEHFPAYLVQNQDRFRHMIADSEDAGPGAIRKTKGKKGRSRVA